MIKLERVSKTYPAARPVHALRDVDLEIGEGEYAAIMGPSGSGKSTLMHVLGCLDRPTEGRYLLAGRDVSSMGDDELARIRNRTIGFVFQTYNLLPRQSALRNVGLPLFYAGVPRGERRRRAMEALEQVGLSEWAAHRPNQLSGGQQQRVAVARALVSRPAFLLADEPTGNLDSRSGQELLAIFGRLNQAGMTLLVVTHDLRVARHARRIIQLFDGRITGDEPNAEPLDAESGLREMSAASGGGSR